MNICHLIDNMEFMATLPDNAFDLSIVDPPYGIGAGKGTSIVFKNSTWKHAHETHEYTAKDWDAAIPSPEYFRELFRVSSDVIMWGGNYFTDYLPPTNGWIVWDKKTTNSIFSPFEMAWTSFKKPRLFRFMMEGYKREKNEDYKFGRIHPTQKPITMYKWILNNYAKPGQTIFDSHVGSGSIRIACHDMGYDFTGCEIDADYHAAQEKRFQTHIAQAQLFEPAELTAQYHQEEL